MNSMVLEFSQRLIKEMVPSDKDERRRYLQKKSPHILDTISIYLVMYFGLTNALVNPSLITFQTPMNIFLAPFLRKFALVFFMNTHLQILNARTHYTLERNIFQVLMSKKLCAKFSSYTLLKNK